MLSKNQIKQINSLKIKKNRQLHKLFIAEGVKVVSELIDSSFKVKHVFALKSWIHENSNRIQGQFFVDEVSEQELSKISSLITPNEVLALIEIPDNHEIDIQNAANQLFLVLDQVKDPGNLGTIIRIADWFGISHLICSDDCVDAFNSKVVQATMGSLSRVQITYVHLMDFLASIPKNIPIYGAVLGGDNIYQSKLSKNGFLVLGNESNGISNEVQNMLTSKLEIPRYGMAESLNVGVAAAIFCSEFKRN